MTRKEITFTWENKTAGIKTAETVILDIADQESAKSRINDLIETFNEEETRRHEVKQEYRAYYRQLISIDKIHDYVEPVDEARYDRSEIEDTEPSTDYEEMRDYANDDQQELSDEARGEVGEEGI